MKSSFQNKCGYTLVEIMMGILVVSIVMIAGFYALSAANIGKVRLMSKGDIDKEAFYFQEKLIDTIKVAGTIDYEEYFNRMVLNIGKVNLYQSGHYLEDSLFGNTTNPLHYCRSKNGSKMPAIGCSTDFNFSTLGADINYSGVPQVYGQYSYMAVDYNSDAGPDLGDDNGDGSIVRDDDDEFLGNVPSVISNTGGVTELYLLSGNKKKRTFLRWKIDRDPKAPVGALCTGLNGDPSAITGTGCLGTIEIMKLEGVDWGYDHDILVQDASQYDGIVDTWIYDRQFYGLSSPILASSSGQYWIPLFSKDINVKKARFFLLPNKDPKLAWKDTTPSVNIAPSLKILLVIAPALSRQNGVKGQIPEFTISTTLNLSPIFSN